MTPSRSLAGTQCMVDGTKEVGTRDPLRHGSFIIIVDQRENSLYKAKKEDALLAIPVYQLFGT